MIAGGFHDSLILFDCNANQSIERTTVEIMCRGLIVYSLSCTSVRVGGWEDCWIGVHRPNSCDRVPSTVSISTYSLPSVHHADGIPVWLLIVGSSNVLRDDVSRSRTHRPSEEISVQEGVASAALHCPRQRSTNILVVWINVRHEYNNNTLPATATRQSTLQYLLWGHPRMLDFWWRIWVGYSRDLHINVEKRVV